VVLGNTSLTEV